jgi:hypothetical protein
MTIFDDFFDFNSNTGRILSEEGRRALLGPNAGKRNIPRFPGFGGNSGNLPTPGSALPPGFPRLPPRIKGLTLPEGGLQTGSDNITKLLAQLPGGTTRIGQSPVDIPLSLNDRITTLTPTRPPENTLPFPTDDPGAGQSLSSFFTSQNSPPPTINSMRRLQSLIPLISILGLGTAGGSSVDPKKSNR